jgi:hypothetical protein
MTYSLDYDKVLKELNEIKYANEYRLKNVKGVKGLSFSDIDTIIIYVEDHRKYHGEALHGRLMDPRGKIKEVLDRYGIKYAKTDPFVRGW